MARKTPDAAKAALTAGEAQQEAAEMIVVDLTAEHGERRKEKKYRAAASLAAVPRIASVTGADDASGLLTHAVPLEMPIRASAVRDPGEGLSLKYLVP